MIKISQRNLYLGLLGTVMALTSLNHHQKAIANELNNTIPDAALDSFDFSTQAQDLLEPNGENFTIAQEIRDLKKFCQNYPYNSRCEGFTEPSSPELKYDSYNERSNNGTDSEGSPWGATFDVGTLGIGASVVRKINSNLNARLGVNAFGLGVDVEDTDVTYESDLDLLNVSLLLDYHIIKNSSFRVTTGLIFNGNEITGTARGNGTIEIGDDTFTSGVNGQLESVDAEIDIHNDIAPYLGIGIGNPTSGKPGLGFWFNAGVMFGGSPEVTITPNPGTAADAATRDRINQAAEREAEDLEDEIDWLNIYPVISIGVNYHF